MTKPQAPDPQPDQSTQAAGERKRDEQRDPHAAYGGQQWKAADERGENERYGTARNDDADPLTLAKGDKDVKDADGAVETGGQHAGMGRGETPREPEASE